MKEPSANPTNKYAYQESEVESSDDGGGDGEGGELEVADVADEGLRDDVDPVERHPLEDGRPHDPPQQLALRPPLRRHRRPSARPLRLQQRRRRLLLPVPPHG